ncbi:MAG: UbiA family prenyltransferase [Candidatus Heimdallarchaeota archaeon]
MSIGTIRAFIKLIRIDHSLYTALGVLLSGVLAGDLHGFQLEYLIAFYIVFLYSIGNYAFNDYYDFELDKRNARYDRPLVSGLLPRKIAPIISIISLFLIILLLFFLDLPIILLVLANLPLYFLYSMGLKKILVVKDVMIGYAFMATIFFGALVSDGILEPLIVYFGIMGLIVGVAFEIMLDVGDILGDKALGIKTLPALLGLKTAALISVILYGVIMILDPLPFFIMIDSRLYQDYIFLLVILIPVTSYLFISKSLLKDQSMKNILNLKNRIIMTMQVGSVAYLIGVII